MTVSRLITLQVVLVVALFLFFGCIAQEIDGERSATKEVIEKIFKNLKTLSDGEQVVFIRQEFPVSDVGIEECILLMESTSSNDTVNLVALILNNVKYDAIPKLKMYLEKTSDPNFKARLYGVLRRMRTAEGLRLLVTGLNDKSALTANHGGSGGRKRLCDAVYTQLTIALKLSDAEYRYIDVGMDDYERDELIDKLKRYWKEYGDRILVEYEKKRKENK